MKTESQKEGFYKIAKTGIWFIIGIGTIAIMTYYSKLLQPLIIALIIWFVIRMVKSMLSKIKMFGVGLNRWIVNILSLLIIFSVMYVVSDILITNIDQMIKKLPEYETNQDDLENKIVSFLGVENLNEFIDGIPSSEEMRPVLNSLLGLATSIVSWSIVILLYTIFLLLEETNFFKKLNILLGDGEKASSRRDIFQRIGQSVKRYAAIKILMSFLTAFLSYWALWILGIDFPFLWAFIIFILNFIPYVGSLIATLLPSLFSGFQYGEFSAILKTFVVIQVIQSLMASVIEPKVVGKTLNLSPLVVMISLTFWGGIWGILGMLISVPITSVLVLIMSQFPDTRKIAIMLSEKGDLDNITGKKEK